ncbi:MAG: hypothetical protein JRN39_06205 [Nitrososphaerota archaeon]|nr:hypothetical protein [Nitrososphaerota archaeon]
MGSWLLDELSGGKTKARIRLDFKLLKLALRKEPVRTREKVIKGMGETLVAVDEAQNLNDSRIPGLLSVLYNESRVRLMFSGSLLRLIKLIEKSPHALSKADAKNGDNALFPGHQSRIPPDGNGRVQGQSGRGGTHRGGKGTGGIPSYYGVRRCARPSRLHRSRSG